ADALRADVDAPSLGVGDLEDRPEAVEPPAAPADLNDGAPRLGGADDRRILLEGHMGAVGPRAESRHGGDDHDEQWNGSEPQFRSLRLHENAVVSISHFRVA